MLTRVIFFDISKYNVVFQEERNSQFCKMKVTYAAQSESVLQQHFFKSPEWWPLQILWWTLWWPTHTLNLKNPCCIHQENACVVNPRPSTQHLQHYQELGRQNLNSKTQKNKKGHERSRVSQRHCWFCQTAICLIFSLNESVIPVFTENVLPKVGDIHLWKDLMTNVIRSDEKCWGQLSKHFLPAKTPEVGSLTPPSWKLSDWRDFQIKSNVTSIEVAATSQVPRIGGSQVKFSLIWSSFSKQ